MNYKKIERKINDIKNMCPIEAGVEILVYNILDSALDANELSVIDINRIWKDQDLRLTTESGIPDIAIVSTDFIWKKEDQGFVYGLVEVKYLTNNLEETEQIEGHKTKYSHYLYTNGIRWIYYFNGKVKWEYKLCEEINKTFVVSEENFNELINLLKCIKWKIS